MVSKQELIDFEKEIAKLWEDAEIPYPVHFSGGNEDELIEIFKNIRKEDYVLSTHRSHYHYLLKGGNKEKLKKMILEGNSMHVYDKELNFFTSAIVAGCPAIAAGIALGIKKKGEDRKVYCFVGDGAEESGHFYEAVRYADGWDLPCTFIIEDNNLSVETPKCERYCKSEINWPKKVVRYEYKRTYPHVGTDKWIDFTKKGLGKAGGSSF